MKKQTKGFTLVELLVVMALIAVLSVLILGAIQLARNTATETVHRSNVKVVQAALESNFAKFKEYCGSASGEIACPTGGDTTGSTSTAYALLGAAKALSPTVNLSTGYSCSSTTNSGKQEGGGRITWLAQSSYVIAPAKYDCTAYTSTNDMIVVGTTTPASVPSF